LAPLSDAAMTAALQSRAPNLEGDDRALIATLAEGSLGHALNLIESDALSLFREITTLLAQWPRIDTAALHKLADKVTARGGERNFEMAAELLEWIGARFLRAAARKDLKPAPEAFPGEGQLYAKWLAAAGLDRWLELWEKVERLFARVLSVNLDRRQAWVTVWLALQTMEAGALDSGPAGDQGRYGGAVPPSP